MRLLVTGLKGQVVTALMERAADDPALTVLTLGRPEVDLAAPGDLSDAFRRLEPDAVVSAAAYTAVDAAETEQDLAFRINRDGAGAVAAAAAALGVPVVHLSTDYVFDGTKAAPYVETDPVGPTSVYGRSKQMGEEAVAAANPDHAILRTAWVYAAEGKNFLRTMLRLAATRPEIAVVADQQGTPTYAPDIADAVVGVARNLVAEPQNLDLRGVFHMSGSGETTWAGFAEAIFRESAARGGPSAAVRPITTADYPTPARRPANSRLDCSRLRSVHGITMPTWTDALARCMDRLQQQGTLTS
jgi:dTDP-4-dehydrorhamnose reductase